MRSLVMIDFDNIEDWSPRLEIALRPYVPSVVKQELRDAKPEYIEDARDLLFDLTNRDAVIDAVLTWLSSTNVVGYHGTRLTDTDIALIQIDGLLPLKAEKRRDRLKRALSSHSNWLEVANQLDVIIKAHGQGERAGRREGQVHLTLSKAGLINGFNHYLTYGSEFDQHVAQKLLGAEGMKLLARDGKSRVIKFAVPGIFALKAAHPIIGIDNIRARGEVPNLVKEFLEAWSYRLANPSFQSRSLKIDCGMMFREIVPATWLVSFDTLP